MFDIETHARYGCTYPSITLSLGAANFKDSPRPNDLVANFHGSPESSHALEDYLKAIYQLSEEAQPLIVARLAAETGVSPSTIFATLRRLAKEGYVIINRRKEIHLTAHGRKVA